MIQVQNDRLHFNWLGESGGPYPRYEVIREGFDRVLRHFIDFVRQESVGDFRPNQWEVTYVNHIPQGTVWKTPGDWRFFRLLGSGQTIKSPVRCEGFTGEWHFQIPEERGRLHISWQRAKRTASEHKSEELVRLMLTARGPLKPTESDVATIIDDLNLGRETIVRSFQCFMSDDANKYWGLKHA
jgi:hypothetical protein